MVSHKIDFAGRDWSAHCQEAWTTDALNPKFPGALRVAFAAYGRHAANGHAYFRPSELAKMLVRQIDGEYVVPDRSTVWRYIRQAVDCGLLAPESKALCLVVPNHRVQGGRGAFDAPCKRHPKRGRR